MSDLFKALNCINNKTKINFNINKISGYMLSLWLSQDKDLINIVNEINPYIFLLDNQKIFWYFYKKVPKKRRFIKWTKKESKKTDKVLDKICLEYGISKKEAMLSI